MFNGEIVYLTCVGPAHRTEPELIGDRDEVDSNEREIVGHEEVLCPAHVVVVGGVAEGDHAQTHAESGHHQQRSPGKSAEQESSDESGEESDNSVDDCGVRLVDV